jgi:hypothetical protein
MIDHHPCKSNALYSIYKDGSGNSLRICRVNGIESKCSKKTIKE